MARLFMIAAAFAASLCTSQASETEGVSASASPAPKDPAKLLSAADREFRNKQVDSALRLFGETISAASAAHNDAISAKAYYGRHKVHVARSNLPQAISDLGHALEKDDKMVFAYLQRANLLLMTGKCPDAVRDYLTVLRMDPSKKDATSRLPQAQECSRALERAEYAANGHQWHAVRAALSDALADNRATHAPSLLMQRAEAALKMGSEGIEDALADLARVLKMDSNNVKAYALRGKALYAYGDFNTAKETFRSGLRVDPEDKECKDGYRLLKRITAAKEQGEGAMAKGQWAAAIEAFEAGYDADRTNIPWSKDVLPKLARAQQRSGRTGDAKRTAEAATAISDDLAEAHAVLAEIALDAEDYEEANRRAKRAAELDRGNGQFQDLAQRADAALRQSKTKDYYKILGVARNADEKEIKRAYRKLALEWHPDKLDKDASEEQKQAAVRKFQDIGEAYECLSDPEKKGKYDRGEDVGQGGQQQGHPGGGHPFGHGHPFGQGFGGGGFTFQFRHG